MRRGGLARATARAVLAIALLSVAVGAPALTYDPDVEAAQSRLTTLGFEPGPVDGLMGGRTRAALRAFQRARGLPDTGRLDAATRAALARDPTPDAAEPRPATPPPRDGAATVRVRPAPEASVPRPPGRTPSLSYEALGWRGPLDGRTALETFRAEGGSPEMGPGSGEIVVPSGRSVWVLGAGEQVPGLDCEPGDGDLAMEFVFGGDGPIVFRSLDDRGFCRLGFGVALRVGQRVLMEQTYWGETEFPRGRVRLTPQGIEYVR